MEDEKFDERLMNDGIWQRITVDGVVCDGPWKFVAQGTIGAYPRFMDLRGTMVPWHRIDSAER